MKNLNLFNKKRLKFFRLSLRYKFCSAYTALWKSTTPAGISIFIVIIKWSGHPSFKRRGNVSDTYSKLYKMFWTKLSLLLYFKTL